MRYLTATTSVACLLLSSACTTEIAFDPSYVPPDRPTYVADGALLIVVREDQREFTYEGPPDSEVGDFTTMTIPMAEIVQEIAADVFGSCFARGVIFAPSRDVDQDYVLAMEANLDDFLYRYAREVDRGFSETDPDVWIIPEVDISFDVDVYDRSGALVLRKTYDSGIQAGERYMVTSRPQERINQVLHGTLHTLMTQAANDLYPLLIGECTVLDLDD